MFKGSGRLLVVGLMVAGVPVGIQAQVPRPAASAPPQQTFVQLEQPDAERTKQELSSLLQRHPPSLRHILALDPSLLVNQAYLAPYPGLAAFLNAHPEIAHNPSFYVGEPRREREDPASRAMEMWGRAFESIAIFAGFGMAIAVITWLIRTLVDYRRWSRLAKVQTDVHTKLLDRFTSNEDLLAYIQSPAGSKFLESCWAATDFLPLEPMSGPPQFLLTSRIGNARRQMSEVNSNSICDPCREKASAGRSTHFKMMKPQRPAIP